MDMLRGEQIAEAELTDWRKLAQGLHARYLVPDFVVGARFVSAVAQAGEGVGHHPRVRMGSDHVDLELVTDDAIYRAEDGTEFVVEWVTQQDVDLARSITQLALDQGLAADSDAVSEIELGLDAVAPASVAPVWAALLTGDAASQGRGTPGDEIRDATVRVPNLWFDDLDDDAAPDTRLHLEVYVASTEVAAQRIAAAVSAGGSVVDDSEAPGLTVLADQEGNRAVVAVDVSAAR